MIHDVVIIGAGHNGLVCSAYLAMAGLKVVVLDQRPIAGGAAVTEEFSPGFFNSTASYAVSLLNPKIIRDLDLFGHGLRIVERPLSNFLPLGDQGFLKVGGGQTKREVAKFSGRDADLVDDYQTRLAAVADVLRASVLETPPNVVEVAPSPRSPNCSRPVASPTEYESLGSTCSAVFSISSRPLPAISSIAGLKARP
jgi:phytoene dehydrogenase-like protein